MDFYKKHFGRRLREARKNVPGMSQAFLAEALGVSSAAVSRWETGADAPEDDRLTDIAKALNTTVDALLGINTGQAANALLSVDESQDYVEASETYDMLAASRAIKEALGMLEKFASLPVAEQKLALAVIYRDPRYLAGIKPSELPGCARLIAATVAKK